MAAAFMPTEEDAPDLYGRPCALCDEPIVEGDRYYQRDTWRILGHMRCVLQDEAGVWDSLPDR